MYNSHFKERLRDNLVYVDWGGENIGHPKVLSAQDFDKLKASDKLFARKFDMDADASIFNILEELIGKQKLYKTNLD